MLSTNGKALAWPCKMKHKQIIDKTKNYVADKMDPWGTTTAQ